MVRSRRGATETLEETPPAAQNLAKAWDWTVAGAVPGLGRYLTAVGLVAAPEIPFPPSESHFPVSDEDSARPDGMPTP